MILSRLLSARLTIPGFALWAGLACIHAAEAAKVKFDIPAGEAGTTLRQFAKQANREIIFPVQSVGAVRTAELKGEMTVREALDRLLSGTELAAFEDEKTGGLVVQRREPEAEKNADGRPASRLAARIEDGTVMMEEVEVTGSRLHQAEAEGVAPLFSFDRQFIESSGFGTTEEFMRMLPQNFTTSITGRAGVPNDAVPGVRNPGQSGAGLFGLGSNNTLVLIDGQRMPLAANGNNAGTPPQGFYDLSTIPLGMIERIEVLTDGASAIYGSDATAGVINIILKKNYEETELRARIGGTWHGGAFERGGTLTHGFNAGKLKGLVVLDYLERQPLFARQRRFSKTADQRANGGTDLRSTTIGSPIRIFALPGQTLNGLNGATNAIAPKGQTGVVTIADFLPTAGRAATTPYDTTHLQALIQPTERATLSSNFTYRLRPTVSLFAQVSYSEDSTDALNVPQFTSSQSGNPATGRIPATNPYNPFGQNLGFIMLHEELGPRVTEGDTRSFRAVFGASVDLPRSWQAQLNAQFSTQRLRTANPILNVPLMQAALNRTDSTALNLFGDPRAGRANAPGVYEAIFPLTIENSKSDLYTAQAFARGPVRTLPSGRVQMAAGLEWQQQDRIRTTNVPSAILPARSRFTRDTWAAFTELSVPVVGEARRYPWAHAVDLQLAARYEDIERAGTTLNPKYGLRWQPRKGVLVRGSYSTGFRAPAPTEYEQPESNATQSITDPRRIGIPYPVTVFTGSNRELKPETSETLNLGLVLSVPRVKGLTLSADFSRKEQVDLTTSLTAQVIVNNEAIFPDRVIRGPNEPDGTPGMIQMVDASFINFGRIRAETVDLTLRYELPTRDWGRITLQATASHFLEYNLLLSPNSTTGNDDLIGTSANFPVKTRGNAYLHWTKGDYGAMLLAFYNGGFRSGASEVASSTTLDVNLSYHWRRHNVRLQGGIGNIFDREPSFLNVPLGYQVGSQPGPKQRTYQFSATYIF